MSILLADIDATCSSLGYHDGNKYYIENDAVQSLKHLIWILRRDNLDSHEYRRYLGHKKVVQTDLLPMLVNYCDNPELADVLLRLLVNLTSPTLLFFRDDLPKDGTGRRTYLDLIEISQDQKETFASSPAVWETLAQRLQTIMAIDVSDRMEEQSMVMERILVLTRNVLQVPTNPQAEKRVDNDISIHDKVLWALHSSGMFELLLFILSSEYENQYQLHALEIVSLIFREQKVETLADASVQRTAAEKYADEQALVAARNIEKAKAQMNLPPARHSRFGGTYVYKNLKSVSDRDLICHQSLERVVQKDFNHDKKKIRANFRLARDDEKYERQSAFCVRLFLREFCIEILTSAFNNNVRQVRRILERNLNSGENGGHDQSYLLWAMRFFLEFNRLNGFKLDLVTEALSTGSIHWICSQVIHDMEMIQTDKRRKIKWNRRLQLGIQAYREFLYNLQVMETVDDEDSQALMAKLKNDMFYVVEYREIVLQLLLNYNENHFTRNYLRDLIVTANVYLKMMEKFCSGSIVVQTKVKSKAKRKAKKRPTKRPKQLSKEEVSAKLAIEWDARVAANLSVVLVNEINLPEEEHPVPFDAASEKPIDEQRADCMTRIYKLLRDEDFERAVLLMRAGRVCWPESECFGAQNAQPEDELMLMKDVFLADLETGDDKNDENTFWDDLENSDEDQDADNERSDDEDEEDNEEEEEEEEEETTLKEVVLNFSDFEKRLLNPKVIRACTWCLQTWEKMNSREIKSAVTLLHRIAVNLDVPVMLMQAQLFRVFQQVFKAPRDARYEELRRLGTFVVRQFVKLAPTNPKIFAELLFFKSHRDCYEVANGYTESLSGHEAKQKGWTEEQEDELRRLFMENQESPATDQDVIDWLVDNLIERSRTRRGVIKKLKELGMIFKAPTKKSNVAAQNKNLFIQEEDDKLRELYDEHRADENCLKEIMEVFDKKRSKKAVVKRMVQLGLIADESEVMPIRKKKTREHSNNHSDKDHERLMENSEKYDSGSSDEDVAMHLNENSFIEEEDDKLRELYDEHRADENCLNEIMEVFDLKRTEKEVVKRMVQLGLIADSSEIMPANKKTMLEFSENSNEEDPGERNLMNSNDETDENDTMQCRKSKKLITKGRTSNVTQTKNLFIQEEDERLRELYNEHRADNNCLKEIMEVFDKKRSQKAVVKRMIELGLIADESEIIVQDSTLRLSELTDDSSDDDLGKSLQKTKKNIIESSDEDEAVKSSESRRSGKRDRSEVGEDSPDENEMNASNKQLKRIKRIVDSSDEE